MLVVGPRDGREQLTQVARSLCTQVQQHCMATKDVDTSLIHNRLYIGDKQHHWCIQTCTQNVCIIWKTFLACTIVNLSL